MGLVSGIVRLQYLKMLQLDLEDKVQTLAETKTHLAAQGEELVSIGTDLDPDSPEVRHLEQRRQKLQIMEKKIDAEMLKYQTQMKMTEAEMQSAQSMVDNSIKRSFTYGNS